MNKKRLEGAVIVITVISDRVDIFQNSVDQFKKTCFIPIAENLTGFNDVMPAKNF